MKSPACRIASAPRMRSMHAAGITRAPRGRWVSDTIASRIARGHASGCR